MNKKSCLKSRSFGKRRMMFIYQRLFGLGSLLLHRHDPAASGILLLRLFGRLELGRFGRYGFRLLHEPLGRNGLSGAPTVSVPIDAAFFGLEDGSGRGNNHSRRSLWHLRSFWFTFRRFLSEWVSRRYESYEKCFYSTVKQSTFLSKSEHAHLVMLHCL